MAGCANSGLLRFDVHPCGHRGDHVKVAAIVAGVQNVYAARAVADGRFTTIPSAIEHLRFKQAANKAQVQSWNKLAELELTALFANRLWYLARTKRSAGMATHVWAAKFVCLS